MVELSLAQSQQQHLQTVLAPQLRQSLEMLQAPLLELRSMIQQELETNPTLEEKLVENDPVEVEPENQEEKEEHVEELEFKETFEVLAHLDEEWREYFKQQQSFQPDAKDRERKRNFLLESLSCEKSLQEHLLDQLALSDLEGDDRQIAETLIGGINDDGYLVVTPGELAEISGYDIDHIESILQTIQEFDPIGVGSRDLQECLLLQLERLGKTDSLSDRIVRHYLRELGSKKYPHIAKAMNISVEKVQTEARFIATLEPKPGRLFSAERSIPSILPEVIVQKVDDTYIVMLHDEQLPRLRISRKYRFLMEEPSTKRDVKKYIQEKIRSGMFLMNSINQRQDTILKIANELVRVQHDFFEHGVSHLKPLTMSEVAEKVGLHETTISRAAAQKYMQTPRGVFEMKYFFTPGYKNEDGQLISNQTVKEAMAKLVTQEDSTRPLSDQAIVEKLKEQGTKIARRTVAKYREELNILSSHLRKSF
ncbi:MAG: RNA polymerase factor sigma-54 [Kiritimatiellae bacterium]|nr:RNA polymerase factor sigma-54 [Kiritimatiellia bacterium]